MSVFVHAQGIKTVHAGGGDQKRQISVHVVVECPLVKNGLDEKLLRSKVMNLVSDTFRNPLIQSSCKISHPTSDAFHI